MGFLLNSQARGVSGKNEQSTQTPWCGAQRSCIVCISLRPALITCCTFCIKIYAFPRWKKN